MPSFGRIGAFPSLGHQQAPSLPASLNPSIHFRLPALSAGSAVCFQLRLVVLKLLVLADVMPACAKNDLQHCKCGVHATNCRRRELWPPRQGDLAGVPCARQQRQCLERAHTHSVLERLVELTPLPNLLTLLLLLFLNASTRCRLPAPGDLFSRIRVYALCHNDRTMFLSCTLSCSMTCY